MTDLNQQLESFNLLDYQVQKEKITMMLSMVKDTHPILGAFDQMLSTIDSPSAELLFDMYQTLVLLADLLRQGKMTEAQSVLDSFKERLAHIRQLEEEDKQKEGDPENILNQM